MIFYALYTCVAGSIWEQLSMPFSDEEFAAFEPSRPMPIGGGCTVDPVGRWDLKGQNSTAWNVLVTRHAPATCCLPAIRFQQCSLASTSSCLHSRWPPKHNNNNNLQVFQLIARYHQSMSAHKPAHIYMSRSSMPVQMRILVKCGSGKTKNE